MQNAAKINPDTYKYIIWEVYARFEKKLVNCLELILLSISTSDHNYAKCGENKLHCPLFLKKFISPDKEKTRQPTYCSFN